jgi:hypothetical protein
MKNAVFWDVTPCGSCKNRRFGGTYRLHHQDDTVFPRSVHRLRFTANVVPSSLILVILMTEALLSTRIKRRNISEDGIFYFYSFIWVPRFQPKSDWQHARSIIYAPNSYLNYIIE